MLAIVSFVLSQVGIGGVDKEYPQFFKFQAILQVVEEEHMFLIDSFVAMNRCALTN